MRGRAFAPGGISLCNAMITGNGATVAIDKGVEVEVKLESDRNEISAEATDQPTVDTTLVETCVSRTLASRGHELGGIVRTHADLPPSVGLKTSSATANAAILATLAALGTTADIDRTEIAHLGVEIAREVGVSITGALDDAMASMLGGLVLSDNRRDRILDRRELDAAVAVVIPGQGDPSASVDVASLQRFEAAGEVAFDAICEGQYELGMVMNGLIVSTALSLDGRAMVEGLAHLDGVTVSGTGPSVACIGTEQTVQAVADVWDDLGRVIQTRTQHRGASIS